jgi:hypothetical protein
MAGHSVAFLVEALGKRWQGLGFDSLWAHCIFFNLSNSSSRVIPWVWLIRCRATVPCGVRNADVQSKQQFYRYHYYACILLILNVIKVSLIKYCDVFGRMPSFLCNRKLDTPVVARQPKVKHLHGYAREQVLLRCMVAWQPWSSVSIATIWIIFTLHVIQLFSHCVNWLWTVMIKIVLNWNWCIYLNIDTTSSDIML